MSKTKIGSIKDPSDIQELWFIQTELKQGQDREEWLTVYYVEHFTLQLIWELKWDQELSKWLTKPFCTLPGELTGELMVLHSNLNVILVLFKFPHKL